MKHPIFPLTALTLSLLVACGGGGGEADPSTVLGASTPSVSLAAAGTARLISVTNRGQLPAKNLRMNAANVPTGTVVRSACLAELLPGASCLILVTPGAQPSAAPGNLAPVSGLVELEGDNTNKVQVQLSVITHGSVHQGGYVFALDDTTPITGGVGGKVLDPLAVSSANWSPSPDAIAGINENSTAGSDSCNGALDGKCNTRRIMAQYTTGSRDFAAALCVDSRAGGFADWYLPALCELGYDPTGLLNGICGTRAAPRLPDNAKSRLYDQGPIGSFETFYWSSSQVSVNAATQAYVAVFGEDASNSNAVKRVARLPSRCARDLTP